MAEPVEDAGFQAAVEAWRKKHQLPADDPLVALVELLRLNPPPRPEATPSVVSVNPPDREAPQPTAHSRVPDGVNAWIAVMAVLAAAVGGFLLGRGWR